MQINSENICYVVALVCILILQRLFVIFLWGTQKWKSDFDGDASIHYAIIRHLRKNQKSRYITNYLIAPEPLSYPTAFHRFASLFSLELIRNKPWLPNLILYIFASCVLLLILFTNNSLFTSVGLVTVLVYFFAPSNWIFQGPAVAYIGLSERYFGRVFCSISYAAIAIGTFHDIKLLFLIGTLSSAIAFLGSIFARQALMFSLPLLSIITLNLYPFFSLILAILLSVVIGKQQMIDGWKHTLIQWKIYKSHTKKGAMARKALVGLFRWPQRDGNIVTFFAKNLFEKDPTRLIFMYPELAFGLFIIFYNFEFGDLNNLVVLIVPLLVYAITITEKFNHLGEAYRYIEYTLLFILPIVIGEVLFEKEIDERFLYVFGFFSIFYIVFRLVYFLYKSRSEPIASKKLRAFLDNIIDDEYAVVFPVSMRLGGDIVAIKENWKSFWWQPGIVAESIYDEYIEEYPFLKKNWKPLAQIHSVTHIVCDKLEMSHISGWQYDFSDQELIAENERYIAYRVVNYKA